MKKYNKFTLTLLAIIAMVLLNGCISPKNTGDSYSYQIGPWLTWSNTTDKTMTVNWTTINSGTAKVYYGIEKEALNKKEQEREKKNKHTVVLKDLAPDTTYYYQIESSGTLQKSKVFTFKTAPPKGALSDYKFIVIGDKQPNPFRVKRSNRIISEAVSKENPDFICQVGDVSSYGGSDFSWKQTLDTIPEMAAERPFLSAIGNHDYYGDGYDKFATFFTYDYHNPIQEKGKYHSVRYADTTLIFMDNFDLDMNTMTEKQKTWARNEIKKATEDATNNWVFLFMHHTFLTTGTSSRNIGLQKWLIPLASEFAVDGIFFGHDHHYEHWKYQYGKNGYLYQKEDKPAEKPLEIWCTGGGGAHLEIDYNLLSHAPHNETMEWYNTETNQVETLKAIRRPWNKNRYIDHTDDRDSYGQTNNHGKNFYQYPPIENYCDDNAFYGYKYGEQAAHYMKIEISQDKTCTISAHYPNGEILSGPDGVIPQQWEFKK